MRKDGKKALSLLLALVLVLSMLPGTAWAAEAVSVEFITYTTAGDGSVTETKQTLDATNRYYVGGMVKAQLEGSETAQATFTAAATDTAAELELNGLNFEGKIQITGDITLKLTGESTITGRDEALRADGALTVKGTGKGTFKTTTGHAFDSYSSADALHATSMTVESGEIVADATAHDGIDVFLSTGINVENRLAITGGSVTGKGYGNKSDGTSYSIAAGDIVVSGAGVLVATGTGANESSVALRGDSLTVDGGTVTGIAEGNGIFVVGPINIVSGSITGEAKLAGISAMSLTMSGGTITGTATVSSQSGIHISNSVPTIRGEFAYKTSENAGEGTTVSDPNSLDNAEWNGLMHNPYLSINFTGNAPAPATVTSVNIINPYTKVHKNPEGSIRGWTTFTAQVTGENYPSQAVKWTVEGNTATGFNGTRIFENEGRLIVVSSETAETLTVKATSVQDTSKSASITVTVVAADAHEYEDNWVANNSYHWHQCKVGGCEEDRAAHTMEDGHCTVCGYPWGGNEPSPSNDYIPTFSPTGGTYSSSQTVTISATIGDLADDSFYQIWYTLDGTDPFENPDSELYEDPLTISTTTTIKAVTVVFSGTEEEQNIPLESRSDIASATYTISSGGGGSSGGGTSSSTTTTTKNDDGSTTTKTENKTTGTVTETTKNTDGSQTVVETKKDGTVTTTETDATGNKTETVEKPDGSSVTTLTQKDGTKATVNTDTEGKVEAEVTLPKQAVAAAQENEQPIMLPVPRVEAAASTEAAPVVTVKTGSDEPVKVLIPTTEAKPGTVAVIVKEDGTEEIVKTSVSTGDGLAVALPDGATVKIVDNSKSFADVPADNWAADAVSFSSARELFNGTAQDTFSPNAPMTRAMMVTVLARFDGADTDGGDTWYEKGAQWAVDNGISNGSNLNDNVSREQLAVMLWRYAGSPEATGDLEGFHDADSVSGYARQAMRWAVEQGIVNGFGDGRLGPQGQATRAQVAQMLKNFISTR